MENKQNIVCDFLKNLIIAVITSMILSYFSFQQYKVWIQEHITIANLIAIPSIAVSFFIVVSSFIHWYINTKIKKLEKNYKIFYFLFFLCGFMLLINSIYILNIKEPQENSSDIFIKIDSRHLWNDDTINLSIEQEYSELFLVIRFQSTNNFSQFPELELEKLSLLKNEWETLVEETVAHKLVIIGLSSVRADEYFYPLLEGEFRVVESGTAGISLNRENQLRINFRNTTEFEGIIDLEFFGVQPQGVRK